MDRVCVQSYRSKRPGQPRRRKRSCFENEQSDSTVGYSLPSVPLPFRSSRWYFVLRRSAMSLVSLMRFCKRRFLLGQRKPRPVTRRRPLLLESLEQRTVPSANLLSKTVAMQPGAQGSSIASPDHLVTSLFYDVLNRQPSRAEINNWMALINDNALNSSQVALGFVTSNEYLSKTIAQDYQQFLGRSPQPSEVGGWMDQISLNGLTLQQITAGFLSSKEYYARQGGTNLSWLTGMIQDVLDRTPELIVVISDDMVLQDVITVHG